MRHYLRIGLSLGLLAAVVISTAGAVAADDLWAAAKKKEAIHRFSTLFTAQSVQRDLNSDEGIQKAIDWCKATGITKVYIESFRGRLLVDAPTLAKARDRFREAGFIVEGCVTTTNVGKPSTGYPTVDCYTNEGTRKHLEEIFRHTAPLFDVVMIDDFLFTQCECDECKAAKGDRSWSDYRGDLMARVSKERILDPAHAVNPKCKVIIKYPEWYDNFHERGYDVRRQSDLFDVTWIGTETRDPDNARWGKKPQYGAYWLSLWSRAFSRGKLGGGWYDPLGTTSNTYVEQGRQTILGLCRESMLFSYQPLRSQHGPADIEALRAELPGQLDLAEFVLNEEPRGVGTYKPENSAPGADAWIFNFLGMIGIPTTADVKFPADAPSLILTYHALADKGLKPSLKSAADRKKPILMTSTLAAALAAGESGAATAPGVRVLALDEKNAKRTEYGVLGTIRALPDKPQAELDALRRPLLEPLGVEFSAPGRVSLYLYGKDKAVVENFNDRPVEARLVLRGAKQYERAVVLPTGAEVKIDVRDGAAALQLPPRSLVALKGR